MKKNHIFAFFIMMLLAVGCSTGTKGSCSVDQNQITPTYIVYYEQKSDTTTAKAYFAFGNQNLTLGAPSAVKESNYTLSPTTDILGTVTYIGSGSGFTAAHTFTFTDCNNKTYTNSVTLNQIGFTSPGNISEASGTTVSFTGGALAANETATASFTYTATPATTGKTPQDSSTSTVGATSITIPGSVFSGVATGPTWAMTLSRGIQPALQQTGGAGGTITGTYYTSQQAVTLTQ